MPQLIATRKTKTHDWHSLSNYLNKRTQKLGHFPKHVEIGRTLRPVVRQFGGLNEVKEKMGKILNRKEGKFSLQHGENYTREMDAVIKKLGYFPSSRELAKMHRHDLIRATSVYHGGFPNARKKFGYSEVKKLGAESLSIWKNYENEMNSVIKQIGHFPRQKELQVLNRADLLTASTKHGGLDEARIKMGYVPLQKKGKRALKHKENFKNEIQEITETLGYLPSCNDLVALGRGDILKAAKSFGGYKKALLATGFITEKIKINNNYQINPENKKLIIEAKKGNANAIKTIKKIYAPAISRILFEIKGQAYAQELYIKGNEIIEKMLSYNQTPEEFISRARRTLKGKLRNEVIKIQSGFSVSNNDLTRMTFLRKLTAKFVKENNREPSLNEIMQKTGYSNYEITRLMSIQQGKNREILDQVKKPLIEGRQIFHDRLFNEVQANSNLNRIEKNILIDRFGLNNSGKPRKLAEIALRNKVSVAGAKTIIKKALEKFKTAA